MPKKTFLLLLFVAFLFSCHTKNTVEIGNDVSAAYMNTARLPSQYFEVNIGQDTTLYTVAGMEVHIPAGALQCDLKSVKLEIKEAFTMQQILAAGLNTTTKDGQPLASNGMFYINTVEGEHATIVKEISIKTPSNEFNPKAQLFTGEKQGNKIAWVDPKAVLQNGSLQDLEIGKSIFKNNCASCHKLDKDLTGPALLHITKRLPRKWLYAFTRNNAKVRASGDCYANNLFNKWNKTQMNLFPTLEDRSMKLLYDYIDQESNQISPQTEADTLWHMPDCSINQKKKDSLLSKKMALILDNGQMVVIEKDTSTNTRNISNDNLQPMSQIATVQPNNYDAIHYQFTIKTFGWHNIDCLVTDENDIRESLLRIQVQYAYEAQVNIFFLIPNKKVFLEGGKLSDDKYYGFHNVDGTIPLPQNENCIVFAVGESQGKPVFGKIEFKAALSQTMQLQLQSFKKEEMAKQLAALGSTGFSAEIQPTKNFKGIDAIDSALNVLKAIKGCDCGPAPFMDSLDFEKP